MSFIVLGQVARAAQVWFLGFWAHQYESRPTGGVNASHYITGYCGFIALGLGLWDVGIVFYLFGTIRACRRTHKKLTRAILGTTLRWLDSTPVGRIIARFTQDIQAIDSKWCLLYVSGNNLAESP